MKGYEEVIFTDQLLHHRCVGQQIQATREAWEKKCAWFPVAQRRLYARYPEIYDECLEKYGDDPFEYYANRIRMRNHLRVKTKSYMQRQRKEAEISMGHIKDYRVSPTTNGEYGSVQPMKLFYCL
ncbi:uncharacterized protein [Drosophila bipectinata]|uniref:uncharacterized protein n=1 Tax=Drosophila bipectinata TaxID=42026 RepID=UPI0007E6FE5F|nr:uncharacterized protein LOC108132417 [Drosophila bipectinata]KAH8278091.1 hypothetical protein KR026_010392 [Drosophila bipectinata]